MKCEIIRDLLPSYIENLTSKESNDEIDIHLTECQDCTKLLNEMKEQISTESNFSIPKEINYLKKIKKHNLKNVLIIGFLIGVLVYLIYSLFSGNVVNGTYIPDYLIARIPYILIKMIIFGCVGAFALYVISKFKHH
jgi:predicted anti-sigma-YlaC factor YlaD